MEAAAPQKTREATGKGLGVKPSAGGSPRTSLKPRELGGGRLRVPIRIQTALDDARPEKTVEDSLPPGRP